MSIMGEEELREKEAALAAKIGRLLPDFVKSCREKAHAVIIHQDSFAADYQNGEYALLGMAIKFGGSTEKKSASSEQTGKHSKDLGNPNRYDDSMGDRSTLIRFERLPHFELFLGHGCHLFNWKGAGSTQNASLKFRQRSLREKRRRCQTSAAGRRIAEKH